MHSVLVGIVKKQLDLWLDSVNHKESFYIKPKLQEALNTRILSIKPPSDIARRPRPISEMANYKANEYRNLLLYYLPCSLDDLLKKCYVDHFNLLSAAIYLLLEERIPKENIQRADIMLNQYCDAFEKFYGSHNVTLNLHLLRHISSAVQNLGPLWSQSAFGLEDNNGVLIKTAAKHNILHSIAWKYIANSSVKTEQHHNDHKIIIVGGQKKLTQTNYVHYVISRFVISKRFLNSSY